MYKILKDATPDFHDLDNLGNPDKDVAISCSSRFVARLYDQKSFASSHHNINKLRVKLATSRDASLVRLPPSEAALRQYILRASFQTKVWHASFVWQNHLCLHQWNTDGKMSRILCIQSI
jgi:hypothetical protein